jgi:type IV secretion system protein VirB5
MTTQGRNPDGNANSRETWLAHVLRKGQGLISGSPRTAEGQSSADGSEVSGAKSNGEKPGGNPLFYRSDPSPHLDARSEFNNRFYDLAKAKRNAQIMAFAALGLAIFLAVAYVRLASTTQITPYVVEVNELGVARAFGPAGAITPGDRVLTAAIGQFIRNARRITSDSQTQREIVVEAYAYADQNAQLFLDDYYSRPENDPRVLSERMRRTVHLEGILRVPGSEAASASGEDQPGSASSWQVRWVERERPLSAGPAMASAWEAVLRVYHRPPETVQSITQNPLGIYVTDLNWGVVNQVEDE